MLASASWSIFPYADERTQPVRVPPLLLPFFVVVLYLFEGYKSPELRRPEQELEKLQGVAVSFLGLVLFNFVVFRSEVFSRYLLVSWFTLTMSCWWPCAFTLRAFYEKLWKAGLCRRRAVLMVLYPGFRSISSCSRSSAYGYDVVGVLMDSTKAATGPAVVPDLPFSVLWINGGVALRMGANVLIVMNPAFVERNGSGQSCAGASNCAWMSHSIRVF